MKEKIKIFWKAFKKNILWVHIGNCTGLTFMWWMLFYFGIVDLVFAIFFTVLYPLSIPLAYYIRVSKHQKIITKIVWVGCGGYVFGLILWLFLGYVLITAPWAPLRILILDAVLRGRIFLLLLPTLCVIAGYIMYRVGKKREWRLPSTWSSPPLNNLGRKKKIKYEVANSSHPT